MVSSSDVIDGYFDFNSYFLFVQILAGSFHCTMKMPTMHIIFVSNGIPAISPDNVFQLVARGYLLPSFFLSLITNKDSHFQRLLSTKSP